MHTLRRDILRLLFFTRFFCVNFAFSLQPDAVHCLWTVSFQGGALSSSTLVCDSASLVHSGLVGETKPRLVRARRAVEASRELAQLLCQAESPTSESSRRLDQSVPNDASLADRERERKLAKLRLAQQACLGKSSTGQLTGYTRLSQVKVCLSSSPLGLVSTRTEAS
ncbi:unnamed protein product [Protopolystoma xenopodis]|uniref:Uncharacterized protein n=1 Tax=Protopolystoma xenopodis TaxID=117903 RepID=A0A448XGA6_9PLAT|nr:unnamed protein product [Protopolystoma xenopodis]